MAKPTDVVIEKRRTISPRNARWQSTDMRRAHHHLLLEWLTYMQHLKKDYPYLISLAVRMNPLNPDARAEITD